jgi:hypothetical protein
MKKGESLNLTVKYSTSVTETSFSKAIKHIAALPVGSVARKIAIEDIKRRVLDARFKTGTCKFERSQSFEKVRNSLKWAGFKLIYNKESNIFGVSRFSSYKKSNGKFYWHVVVVPLPPAESSWIENKFEQYAETTWSITDNLEILDSADDYLLYNLVRSAFLDMK